MKSNSYASLVFMIVTAWAVLLSLPFILKYFGIVVATVVLLLGVVVQYAVITKEPKWS